MNSKILAFAILAMPFSAIAGECTDDSNCSGINYTYVEADYVYEEGTGFHANGLGITGSYAFTDDIFATASFARTRESDSWRSDDVYSSFNRTHKNWTIGLGHNRKLGSRADWVSQLAYARHDAYYRAKSCFEGDCLTYRADGDLSGFNISTGVRGNLTEKLSGNAYFGYEDYNHGYDGNAYADFGLGYSFNPKWSVQTGVRMTDDGGDSVVWNLGARVSF